MIEGEGRPLSMQEIHEIAAGQSPGPVVPLRQLQGRKGVVQFRRCHQPPQNPVKYMTCSPPGARTTCGSVA